jgi:hypothetical protein
MPGVPVGLDPDHAPLLGEVGRESQTRGLCSGRINAGGRAPGELNLPVPLRSFGSGCFRPEPTERRVRSSRRQTNDSRRERLSPRSPCRTGSPRERDPGFALRSFPGESGAYLARGGAARPVRGADLRCATRLDLLPNRQASPRPWQRPARQSTASAGRLGRPAHDEAARRSCGVLRHVAAFPARAARHRILASPGEARPKRCPAGAGPCGGPHPGRREGPHHPGARGSRP